MGMYIGMVQGMRDYVIELNRTMQQSLGTTAPFTLARVPPDDMFTEDMLETIVYQISDLREFHTYLPEENAPATFPVMEDPGMAGLTYYVNVVMIIGRHSYSN